MSSADIFSATCMRINDTYVSYLQLRESMEQDNQKAVHLRSQINDLEMKITKSQRDRQSLEAALEQLRALQSQIDIKEAKREMLVKLKAKQYQDLEEENDGTCFLLEDWWTSPSKHAQLDLLPFGGSGGRECLWQCTNNRFGI